MASIVPQVRKSIVQHAFGMFKRIADILWISLLTIAHVTATIGSCWHDSLLPIRLPLMSHCGSAMISFRPISTR
jgi:hypothetical protein